MPLHHHLGSLSLVRLLQEWAPSPGEPSRQDVAERLGEWLSPVASVQLDGALQAIASYGIARERQAGGPAGSHVDADALDAACRRVKQGLTDLIAAQPVGLDSAEGDYAPYCQRYAELQKQMDGKVAACRAHVRQAMGKGAPALRQLAALDQVMAGMLGEREQRLLGALPVYLERRFTHWRQVHERRMADAAAEEGETGSGHGRLPGGWPHAFHEDMRRMLLAELQARLQPVLGLIEAARAAQASQADNGQMDRHPA